MTDPPSTPRPRQTAPDWVADAVRAFVRETSLFCRTAIGFSRHPGRFITAWAAGEQHALNPLGFLATSAAILGTARVLALMAMGDQDSPDSLWIQLLDALGPFAHYLAIGLLCHVVLRLLRVPIKRRATDSAAAALYAGGGPAMAAELVSWLCVIVAHAATDDPGVHRLVLAITFGAALRHLLPRARHQPRRIASPAVVGHGDRVRRSRSS